MEIGKTYQLTVVRKTDLGCILKANDSEVFLHNNEATKLLQIDEVVEAFIYLDFKNRIAATMAKPIISLNQANFVRVVEVKPNLGVFVDIGIQKDLLVGKDDLPKQMFLWPVLGDFLFVRLKAKQKLVGKPLSKNEIKDNFKNIKENDLLDGYVLQIIEEGIFVLSLERTLIFVHHTQLRKPYRLGEKVSVRIIKVYEHRINGSLIEQKEKMIEKDAQIIFNYLKKNKKMKLTSNSTPEEIKKIFFMSKKAFKRALGSLYKQRLLDFENEYTIFKGDNNEK